MSEAKHTPGPWNVEVVKTSIGSCFKVMPIHACLYADNLYEHNRLDLEWQTKEADAALIAAAPDLLAALESIENDDGRIPKEIWDLRNAAIAKAKGKS